MITSLVSSRSAVTLLVRSFSSNCAPAQKLRNIFEEYRKENYSRETPKRFRTDLIKVAQSENGTISVDSLNRILVNIGRSDQVLTEEECQVLLQEAGASESRSIPTSKMLELVESTA